MVGRHGECCVKAEIAGRRRRLNIDDDRRRRDRTQQPPPPSTARAIAVHGSPSTKDKYR